MAEQHDDALDEALITQLMDDYLKDYVPAVSYQDANETVTSEQILEVLETLIPCTFSIAQIYYEMTARSYKATREGAAFVWLLKRRK